VFDEVTKREGGQRAARRGAFLLGSSAVQIAVVSGVIFLSAAISAKVAEGPLVPVKIVKSATPPPPPPPPPAPKRKTPPKPRTEAPKPRPQMMAMVQPKEVPLELKEPDKTAPPEEEDTGDEGVEGGVIGGVVGATAPAPSGPAIEDAPSYGGAGYKKPQEAQRGCVTSSLRFPKDLAGYVSSVTVKFAIGRDGQPSLFQVMGGGTDPRIAAAIWQAIQSCQWQPGADPQGRPTKIWMIMPVRFQG
jgi:periplasmic protein TonB